jgi:hypothetical protein
VGGEIRWQKGFRHPDKAKQRQPKIFEILPTNGHELKI